MKINRYFEIVYLLLERKKMTAASLAKYFEVSPRTIYRDIQGLLEAGIPICMTKGKGGGISLLPDFVLNKAFLTEEDRMSLLTSLKAVDLVSHDKNKKMLNKISAFFGRDSVDWIEIDFSSWNRGGNEKENFKMLKEAVISRNTVVFYYSSNKGERTERLVEPLKLCYKGSSWYLYAYCRTREENRFFKLKRINDLEVLEEIFCREIPSEIFEENAFEREKTIKLKLKINLSMAHRVFDEIIDYKKTDDGFFLCEIDFPEGPWLFSYIASFGENCEVLEPSYLRNMMREKFINISKKYL